MYVYIYIYIYNIYVYIYIYTYIRVGPFMVLGLRARHHNSKKDPLLSEGFLRNLEYFEKVRAYGAPVAK